MERSAGGSRQTLPNAVDAQEPIDRGGLRLENRDFRLPASRSRSWCEEIVDLFRRELSANCAPLRFCIAAFDGDEARLEATILHFDAAHRHAERLRASMLQRARRKAFQSSPFCVVQIIPTGVRCAFGGYAGDATPVTNLLAGVSDLLITHPNAVNASDLNEMAENVLYVEGHSLDAFLLGGLGLRRVAGNRVGTFVDRSGLDRLAIVTEAIDAGVAVAGLDCASYTVLEEQAGVSVAWSEAGRAVGRLRAPEAILAGVEHLLSLGVDAIGGVSVIEGVTPEDFESHLRGELPNPSGGVEAIITHLISKVFRVPTAHAPLPYCAGLKERSQANPRAAAEFISLPHYFCALKGLSRAPRLLPLDDLQRVPGDVLSVNNVAAVVMPASCLGGVPALAAELSGIPLIAVRENASVLEVTNEKMQLPTVIEVQSYLEAAGVLVALRQGIALRSLRRPVLGAERSWSRREGR